MYRTALRRGSRLAIVVAAFGSATFGFTATAGAAPLYEGSDIVLTGGEATAINQCVNNASDGTKVDQRNACTQIATAGNVFIFENVTIVINEGGRSGGPRRFADVGARISGGDADIVRECVDDARRSWRGQHGRRHGKHHGRHHGDRRCGQRGNRLELNDVNLSLH